MTEKTVLLCHPSSDLYGSDRMAAQTAFNLAQQGWTVKVVLPQEGPLAEKLRRQGTQVHLMDLPVLRKEFLSPRKLLPFTYSVLKATITINRYLIREKPTVLYVNTIVQPWWLLVSRIMRLPTLVHVREAETELPRPVKLLLNLPLALSTAIICNSKATQAEVLRSCPLGRNRTTVVYNGKDWSSYTDANEIGDPEVDLEKPVLRAAVVGRLSPRKGQDVAIRAMDELNRRGILATVQFVGDTFAGYEWFEQELRELSSQLSVQAHFVGFMEDVAPVLRESDVVIVPSRLEPFGTVAAEAMATGSVTLVSDVQGLIEIVTHNETGLIFRSEDPVDLADKLQWVSENRASANLIAKAGQEHVLRTFSAEQYALAIERLLLRVARVEAEFVNE